MIRKLMAGLCVMAAVTTAATAIEFLLNGLMPVVGMPFRQACTGITLFTTLLWPFARKQHG